MLFHSRYHHHSSLMICRVFQEFIFHFRHPVGERRINETVYNELCLSVRLEIGTRYAFFIFSIQNLSLVGILLGVQDELCVDDVARKWKDVERPMNEMIPIPCYVKTADFAIASCLVLNCYGKHTHKCFALRSRETRRC